MTDTELERRVTLSFDGEVVEILSRIERHPIPDSPLVFLGASSVRLWTDLAERLRSDSVVRVGFGGATAASITHYLPKMFAVLKPSRVVIWPGSNDIGNLGKTAQQAAECFIALIDAVATLLPGVPVYFVSAFVPPGRQYLASEILAANELVEAYLVTHETARYVEAHKCFIGDNSAPIGFYFDNDGIHLNRDGYDCIESILCRALTT